MQLNFLTENQHTIEAVHQFLKEWNDNSPTIITRTSGSTGIPKEIEIEKKHMIASAKMTGRFLDLKEGDSAFLCLSPNTIAGKMMMVRSVILGLDLTIGDVVSRPLERISNGFDFIAMVPMQIQNSIAHDLGTLNGCSKIIVGGGVVSSSLFDSIQTLDVEVFHTFGMTETISHVAMRNLSNGDQHFTGLPNVSFELNDNSLVITANHLGVDNLGTNDIVTLHSPTSFTWLGRKDFVINSGGVKIHPELVEYKLSNLIQGSFFISGISDDYLGEKVILCVESKDQILHKRDFQDLLASHQIPKEIYFFESFQRTDSDKINRPKTLAAISSAKKQVL